jgi:hypothetical protein
MAESNILKLYVHNYFSNNVFTNIAVNTTNRIFNIDNKIGDVFCEYNSNKIHLIFNPEFNDNDDGYHIVDIFDISVNSIDYKEFKHLQLHNTKFAFDYTILITFLNKLYQLIKTKKNWIILNMTTEKQFFEYENIPKNDVFLKVDNCYNQFKNHKIITDNIIINDYIDKKCSNYHFTFTNVIMNWNSQFGIRYFYEFKNIYDKLNFEYDLVFSARKLKEHRIELLINLKKLNNNKIYLQYSDATMEYEYSFSDFNIKSKKLLDNDIQLNSKIGNVDFDNLNNIDYNDRLGLDLFFRLLPKAKMQILDEAWAFVNDALISNHISEKTIGLILAGIPFISTHEYPLDILQKIFKLEPHPFYNEIKKSRIDRNYFITFIKEFLNNFEENYILCKTWTDSYHTAFMNKINNENSLFDLISNDFKKDIVINNTNLI